MSDAGSDTEGLDICIAGGVNQDLKPFCVVEINGKEVGQLPPSQVRSMALQWLEAAANSVADAAVARHLRSDLDLEWPAIGAFICSLRDHRQNADADADADEAEQ